MRALAICCVALAVASCSSDGDKRSGSSGPATTEVADPTVETPATSAPTTTTVPTTEPTTTEDPTTTEAPPDTMGDPTPATNPDCAGGEHIKVEGGKRICVPNVVPTNVSVPVVLDPATVGYVEDFMCDFDFALVNSIASVELDEPTFDAICAGGTLTVVSTRDGEPITPEEFAAVLVAPANAWLSSPSGPGFDTLAAAANQLVDSNRPFASPEPLTEPDVLAALAVLQGYPGRDYQVAYALRDLSAMAPGLFLIVGDGSFTVGVDIQPGRYRTVESVVDCYWETLDESAEINDNNFVNAAPQVIMTVRGSDFAVNSEDCGPWVRIG